MIQLKKSDIFYNNILFDGTMQPWPDDMIYSTSHQKEIISQSNICRQVGSCDGLMLIRSYRSRNLEYGNFWSFSVVQEMTC